MPCRDRAGRAPSGNRRSASGSASSSACRARARCGRPGAWRRTRTPSTRSSPARGLDPRGARGHDRRSLVKKDEVLLVVLLAGVRRRPAVVLLRPRDARTASASEQTQTHNPGRVVEGVERFANTLRNLGVSEQQLEEMREQARTHAVHPHRLAGRRVRAGAQRRRSACASIAASSSTGSPTCGSVWILADVYENQAPFIRRGRGRADHHSQIRTAPSTAEVSRVGADLRRGDPTLKVRLETDNPGVALKPGMFVDVEFDVEMPPAIAVPADAIVDSGPPQDGVRRSRQRELRARRVETGWRLGDQVEIVKGLMEGERDRDLAATSSLDSESRMKAVSAGIFDAGRPTRSAAWRWTRRRPRPAGRTARARGHDLLLLRRRVQEEVRGRAGEVPSMRATTTRQPRRP